MLLVVDVGNTNITFGVFAEQKLEATFRMTTKLQRTSDEYGICIRDLISHNKLNPEKIRDVIIASVVPNVMHSLLSSFIKYFDIKPVVVEPGIKTGIRIATENPRQLGADRIVDAAAAFEQYGGPVFVIDVRTAGRAAAKSGKRAGIITEKDAFLEEAGKCGFDLFCCGSEISFWKKAGRDISERIHRMGAEKEGEKEAI